MLHCKFHLSLVIMYINYARCLVIQAYSEKLSLYFSLMAMDWQAKKVVSTRTHITEGGIKDASSFDKICTNTTSENESVEKCTLIDSNSNTDLEKFRTFIASKGKILSETAIKVLIRKRNALVKSSYSNY